MKITLWHLSIGFGILICYLSWLLVDTYWYKCFTCHGITPSLTDNLFCFGVYCTPSLGMIFIAIGLYGILNPGTKTEEK